MYPIIMGSSTFTNNQDYYLNELYTYNAASSSMETTHICDVTEMARDQE